MSGAVPPPPLCAIMEWAWKTFPFINTRLQNEFHISVGPQTTTDFIPAAVSICHTYIISWSLFFFTCRESKHACLAALKFTVLDFQGLLKRKRNVHGIIRWIEAKKESFLHGKLRGQQSCSNASRLLRHQLCCVLVYTSVLVFRLQLVIVSEILQNERKPLLQTPPSYTENKRHQLRSLSEMTN